MSYWTHVTATFRIDCLDRDEMPNMIKKVMGQTLEFGEAPDPNTYYLPYGSEGSLHYEIIENPNETSIAAYTVTVFGDLRDYTDADAIIEWFESVCSNFMMRQAVITLYVNDGPVIYGALTHYDADTNYYDYTEMSEDENGNWITAPRSTKITHS